MVINGDTLLLASPISDMEQSKRKQFGVSHGLAEVGYDIRLKQEILFIPGIKSEIYRYDDFENNDLLVSLIPGNFVLASAIEHFQMPPDLVGIVHDKSTWARQGLSVFNTVIEPGWQGYLTLELAFRGNEPVHIPAGAGIAQVIFHQVTEPMAYSGKYQNQEDRPVASLFA
jgi:dCTP deaminase